MRDFDGIDELQIPDIILPWPARCAPEVDVVQARTLAWAERHELFPTEGYRARIVRAKYATLAARCYPDASGPLLQTISDYVLWFFVVDDMFVDRVDTVTPRVIPSLTAMVDVLDLDRIADEPVFGATAWLDITRRLRALLTPEHFERFASGMRLWATAAALQILNHTLDAPVGARAYRSIRRHTSGMNPCLSLCDAGAAGSMTPAEFHSPEVRRLRQHTNDVVSWSNDMQSLVVELRQPGQHWNLVTVHTLEGRSLQEAVDHVATQVRTALDAFTRLALEVEESASAEVRGAIAGMRSWMRGYQDWVTGDTQRYARRHLREDADDRDLVAGPTGA